MTDQLPLFAPKPANKYATQGEVSALPTVHATAAELAGLCIINAFVADTGETMGTMAFPRHADGMDGICKRCGSVVPRLLIKPK